MNDFWMILRMIAFFAVIVPLFYYFILKKITKKEEDEIFKILLVVFLTMVTFIAFNLINMTNRESQFHYSQDLVALQDSEVLITSRFSADSTIYYYFMVRNGDTYKSRQVKQNKSLIRYSKEKPQIKVYKKEARYKVLNWVLPNEYTNDYRYVFYVPKGTIEEDFNIDLQ